MIKQINSLQNPLIKMVVALHSAKGRAAQRAFIAEGWRTCQTLLQANIALITLYVEEEKYNEKNIAQMNIAYSSVVLASSSAMKKMSATLHPSGILGVFSLPQQTVATEFSSGIVLAEIRDPGNMGTLIRTAAAMNKKTVIIIESADPWQPKVVQASAGTIGLITIIKSSWQELLAKKNNIPLAALVASGGEPIEKTNLQNALMVIGNEAHGIRKEWLADCDKKITLNMPGNTESLNAAIAGSIALYISAHQK